MLAWIFGLIIQILAVVDMDICGFVAIGSFSENGRCQTHEKLGYRVAQKRRFGWIGF
jgi:hypothetical protein